MGFERGDKHQPVRGLAVQSKEIVYTNWVAVHHLTCVVQCVHMLYKRAFFLLKICLQSLRKKTSGVLK